jgi:diphosphomevalonate decarboxylase
VSREVVCRASPSLALIKYWGKAEARAAGDGRSGGSFPGPRAAAGNPGAEVPQPPYGENRPATPSLAVTLGGVSTETVVREAEEDQVFVDGLPQDRARFSTFFARLRETLRVDTQFRAESRNDFPSSAGLASSSSGFAALTAACVRLCGREMSPGQMSDLARTGSASAARSLYGGFVLLPAGARRARQLHGPEFWPELRVLVVVVTRAAKPVSSRAAMERTRLSSPYYRQWIRNSAALLRPALEALEARDLERLGESVLLSYSRMHAAILASAPPLLYWLPLTVAVIQECASLRREGLGAWETIDAGPQVKVLCLERDLPAVRARLSALDPSVELLSCSPGPGPSVEVREGRPAP